MQCIQKLKELPYNGSAVTGDALRDRETYLDPPPGTEDMQELQDACTPVCNKHGECSSAYRLQWDALQNQAMQLCVAWIQNLLLWPMQCAQLPVSVKRSQSLYNFMPG